MSRKVEYRGEVLANVDNLTQRQTAARIRHALDLDRSLCRAIRRHRSKHRRNEGAGAVINAIQAWIDLGLEGVTAVESRHEVSIYTRRRSV